MNLRIGDFYQDPNFGRLRFNGKDKDGGYLFTSYTLVFGRWEPSEVKFNPVFHKTRLTRLQPAKSPE